MLKRAVEGETDSARELRDKKRALAALVVHDLRSPLAAVHGYLQLLRDEIPDPSSSVKQYLDEVGLLIGKALGLVATILDIDELEDGMLRVIPSRVKLIDLVERARTGNHAHLDVRELRCDIDIDPELAVVLDKDLMGRVIENLLENAMRYAPRRGRCAVASRISGDGATLEITVGNSGPAVPIADREAIFGRYFQVERRRASARENRGLGLYFCKLAVEAHRGTIHVEQRGELGAVFVVRIPYA
jgi:signal transduction histidine kinase